ncbi:oleosin 1-like [Momordica charantia]|uniref:Oleosin n=1 Tax=Momordica charantia TaxID=3673 RepID=A0A6J1E2L5_MOMCH|nr:oleosin 1-like [Momordica charantia]
MAEVSRDQRHPLGHAPPQSSSDQPPRAHRLIKAATAAAGGASLLVLSAFIVAGTVIALAVATPLFVIFSPVLVPALITVSLIGMGFLASGGFAVVSLAVFSGLYRYLAGKRRDGGGDLPEQGRYRLGGKGREVET